MKRENRRRPGLGRALLVIGAVVAGVVALSHGREQTHSAPPAKQEPEKYRLVHAIGNNEKVVATGLSKRDCEARKVDNITIATALGTHSEQLGVGSVTCLPDSLF